MMVIIKISRNGFKHDDCNDFHLIVMIKKMTGLSIRLLRRLRPTAPSFPGNNFEIEKNLTQGALNVTGLSPIKFSILTTFISNTQDNVIKELSSTEQRSLLHLGLEVDWEPEKLSS